MENHSSDQHIKVDAGWDFAAVIETTIKHGRLILAVAAAVVCLVAFWVLGQTKFYEAHLTLKIEPRALRPLGSDVKTPGESYSNFWADQEYFATQHKIIASRSIAEETVRVLGLHEDRRFMASLPSGAPLPPPPEKTPKIEQAAEKIRKRLTVVPVRDSRLVDLTFEDPDPVRAQKILLTLTEAYIEETLRSSIRDIGNASTWLNDQKAELKKELEAAELALHDFKKEKRLLSVSLDDQSNMLNDEMEQLNSALTNARTSRERLASRVSQLNRVTSEDPGDLPVSELLDSPTLQSLRQEFLKGQSALEAMRGSGRGENHPEVLQAKALAASARVALLEEVRNIKQAAQRDLAAIQQEIAGLDQLYKAAEQRAFDLNLLEIKYKRLDRARENTDRLYSIVLERSKESELSGQMRFNNVSVIDPPLRPKKPSRPRVALTLALGGILGIALGFGVVVLRERLDIRVKTAEDIERDLGVVCLGTVPEVAFDGENKKASILPRVRQGREGRKRRGASARQQPELWVHENPTSGVAEALRSVRTNLTFAALDEPYKKILVTSASPTDGKTTIAISLGITMAQAGQSVLLIDADLRKPRMSRVFPGVDQSRGVTTALLDPAGFGAVVQETGVTNLNILPSGPLPPNPSELLHSAAFERVLAEARQRFDRVIIDSPPLMAVTDAAILSKQVDSTILVARSMSTRKDHARRALRALRDVHATLAGAVLNGVRAGDQGYGYGYYEYRASTEDGPSARTSA